MLDCINNNHTNIYKCIEICKQQNWHCFKAILDSLHKPIKVKLLCNWTSSHELTQCWSKMSKGNYQWDSLKLVTDETPDYWVIINKPPQGEYFLPEKTVVFQMEPNMALNRGWGIWGVPDESKFFKVFTHTSSYNNIEWHLSWTYSDFKATHISKSIENKVSTVLSKKYSDFGQKTRVDFARYLSNHGFPLDIFGSDLECGNYKGSLPYHAKDNALFPYKYTFNAENNRVINYFTEKIIDGILAECVVFYWGCPNIEQHINEECYVVLPLEDFKKSEEIIRSAIENDLWSKKIDAIRAEKKRILDEMQSFPRLHAILN